MREVVKTNWKRGDILSAKQVSILARIASRVGGGSGSFSDGVMTNSVIAQTNLPLFVQSIVIVTEVIAGGKTYNVKRRYYDPNSGWTTANESAWLMDGSDLDNTTLEVDDKIPAYWDSQRSAYVPMCCDVDAEEEA